ncbi:MAG TPA: 6-phosphogluconolactonase [Chitinophagaceae bacterium]|nr:6-phosphogluconolactonase [Chitinophagaceae bacterium]
MKTIPDKTTWKDHETMSLAAAHFFVAACHRVIAKQGKFSVALSGGNTPKRLYELLASNELSKNIPWKKVFLFWSDERFVSHSSPDSNYNMVKKSLLDKIDIPPKNIFPVPVTGDPGQNARQYEATIRKFFANKSPAFDWLLLGTGNDGHTASLFPNTPVLIENRQLIKQVWIADKQSWRITFTFPLINKASQIIFLVSGKEKSKVVSAVFNKPVKKIYPVQYVNAEKSLWMLDKAAAG